MIHHATMAGATSSRAAALLPLLLAALATGGCELERDSRAAPVTRGAAPAGGGSFGEVVESVLPAVVFIQPEMTPPPELEQLLPPGMVPGDEPLPVGAGSGVIFHEDGYILTNNHVVQDADRVIVVLHDRRYFEAEVVGRDPGTEVAVVRIAGEGFPTAPLGDSDAIRLGDWVLAVGSPLGLEFSVTAGVVSGTGRALGIVGQADPAERATALEHFIQTDAALSPGNSGGPLVNGAGEVIGINTAVAAAIGSSGGPGFAIPSNIARRVAEQLIRRGEVRRPALGVRLMNVTPSFARSHGLQRVEGAVVVRAEPGSPAEAAGLTEGDVIVGIGDEPVTTVSELQAHLLDMDPGTAVRLRVLRDGRTAEVSVELASLRTGVGPEG